MNNNQIVEYEANGEKVRLSPATVRAYLVSGGGNVSDQEVMMFLSLCRYQHLNPFLKEAYLIKYGSNDPATIVTGKDVFTKRANANPNYSGKKAGVIVLTKSGEVIEREGAFVLPTETLVGGWAKVYIKGHEAPEYAAVALDEYMGRKKNGEPNSNWAKRPGTMIRKVAVVHALREAFPDSFQGLYSSEEMSDRVKETLDSAINSVQNFAQEQTATEVIDIEQPQTEPEQIEEKEEKAEEKVTVGGEQAVMPGF